MSKVVLSFAAKEDLGEIQTYISKNLGNPSAAKGILQKILSQIRMLEEFPETGKRILLEESAVCYRYLVHSSYMSFYHIENDTVIVDRILYGRRNYIRLLLGNPEEVQ